MAAIERAGQTFTWEDRVLAYEEHGASDRVVVLLHPLLFDRRFHGSTARALADAGFRVVTVDLLGHGGSDHPVHASEYRMDVYAEQVVALLDHLAIPEAVLLGTSLGANVSLFVAVRHPDRVRGLVVEMPVLEWAIAPTALVFVPLVLALHYAAPVVRAVTGALASLLERSGPLDVLAAPLQGDPASTAAVLHGLMVGPVAPTADERRAITAPTLVLGHHADLIHPFTDADRLVRLLPEARLLESRTAIARRLRPRRLGAEIEAFLTGCWPADEADLAG